MLRKAAIGALLTACAAPPAQSQPPATGQLAALDLPRTSAPAAASGAPADVPERDPAARGRSVNLYSADLPDDRDGDGVDQLELCPELPPDRVDGCPRAR
jgi:hypothetical protein